MSLVTFSALLIVICLINLNFNSRVKSLISKSYGYFFEKILLIDQTIYKEKKLKSGSDKLTFLVVGHTYNATDTNTKLETQTDPSVLRFIKKESRNENIDYIFYLGDLVRKTTARNILKADKEVSLYNKNFIKVMGNHDVHLLSYLLLFKNNQSSYFVSEFGENLLVVLNTTLKKADINDRQLKFVHKMIEKKKFKNIIFFTHHVVWIRDTKYFPLVNNGSIKLRDSSYNFHKFIDNVMLAKDKTRIVVVSGDMGNNAPYISKKTKNVEYYGIGHGSSDIFIKNKVYGSALKINLSKNGALSIDKMTIH